MQAHTHTPAGIFGHHIRYVVPLFQRPYVWTKEDQWEPLWADVRNVAEGLLELSAPVFGAPDVAPHFLGAIVLDQPFTPSGFIGVRHIVDGQQRLTTLQLLLDAAQWVVEQHGAPRDAQALRVLILNEVAIAEQPDEVFKVWPTDRDQAAFRAAMANEVVLPSDLAESRVAKAHAFFVEQVTEWAEVTGDVQKCRQRLNVLVRALRDHLKLVVIDLEPGDNAQVIFETLNHRGTPLLAADLVKNLVFQRAQAEGADVQVLYQRYWRALDSDYWRALVAQGRLYRPRIDVFLNYWLTMKLLREVPSDRIFSDFRDNLVGPATAIGPLLAELASDAKVYEAMEQLPTGTREAKFHYRVIRALDTAAVGPFLLWVLRQGSALPDDQKDRCLGALESWIVRRALCRATAKDVNRMAIELLRAVHEAEPGSAGDAVEALLAGQTADSRYWPDDKVLHQALDEQPLYTSITRPRLRMVLEAIEDSLRTGYGEGTTCPRNLTVEHVMPRAWRDHWGKDIAADPVAAIRRDRLVQSIGNLTLVTGKFNSVLSNRPWTNPGADESGLGGEGKRGYLQRHSELKLNSTLVAEHEAAWTEDDIRRRSADLVDRLARIWPTPVGAVTPEQVVGRASLAASHDAVVEPAATPADPDDDDDVVAEEHTGKYQALWRWLNDQDADEIHLSFAQVEQILDLPLPPSARTHLPHWYGYEGTALGRAIRDAGWKASQVSLEAEKVVFVRDGLSSPQPDGVHADQDELGGGVSGPSSLAPADAQLERMLQRFEGFDPTTAARVLYRTMVQRGWEPYAPQPRGGRESGAAYVRLVYVGRERRISLYLNTVSLSTDSQAVRAIASKVDNAALHDDALYLYHSEGRTDAAIAGVMRLEQFANGDLVA